jgi:hypothetical protein
MSTTTRAGATALAASIATALTTAGGAGALDLPKLPIVEAAQQDVANVTAAVQPIVAHVAPNTQAAVSATTKQVLANVDATVHSVRDTAVHTVKATKFFASAATTQAGMTVRDTSTAASRVARNASKSVSHVMHNTSNTASRVSSSTGKFARLTSDRTMGDLRSGSIVVAKPVMGGWQLRWLGSTNGCTELNNHAPELLLLQPFRIGVAGGGHTTSIDQQGMSSSIDLGC